ncbi:MAG: YihY/virulence factor BrkB family protein [Burkholderiaceae bacterium]|jgi:membrane protein|nr:YihY/virulence factor BrkB family protein [Burkholderiaceae bacterium]
MQLGVPITRFVRELFASISDDNVFNGAAALGFYLTLSIFPAMIFLMAVIPYLPIERVDQAIMDLLHQAMPGSAADMFQNVVTEVTSERRSGLLSFGLLAALWAASSGMAAIMQQLNITYDVKEGRGIIKTRAIALGLTLLFALLVLGALSLVVLGGVIQDWIGARFGVSELLLMFFATLRWVLIVGALLLAFALIYYLAPDVEQRFTFVTPGSLIATALLVIASLGFSFYAANFGDYDKTYGSIGAVIILMFWLYIAGLVILLGSEINALVEHYAADGKNKGDKREPASADKRARGDGGGTGRGDDRDRPLLARRAASH